MTPDEEAEIFAAEIAAYETVTIKHNFSDVKKTMKR